MAYSGAEVKSGILISLSLVLLMALTFVVGKFQSGDLQTRRIQFGYVSGLEKNAPVRYAGHEVGKVQSIVIRRGTDKPVLVTVTLDRSAELHKDSGAFIDTLGMMGEKFVELSPGRLNSAALAEGDVLTGIDPVPMHLLIQKMNLMADRMDELTRSLNPMIDQLNTTLSGHQEEIGRIIANLDKTTANIRDMTNELKVHPWRLVRKG